jgi:hypothetical protein
MPFTSPVTGGHLTCRAWIGTVVVACCAVLARAGGSAETGAVASEGAITYEAFGAVGDGEADDLPAICKAHEHANRHGRSVRSNPKATYHLGRRSRTAVIATDTDWSTSRFIIDDSRDVENHRAPLFEVRSLLKPVAVKLDRLKRDQARLDARPPVDCLVYVENRNRKIYIRRGLNRNSGTAQREVFILRRDGSVEGAIAWDYDSITRIEARPLDPKPLVVRGGHFTTMANRMRQKVGYNYWGRNIRICRSNTEINGLTHKVTGETDVGHPYSGFLNVQRCANITLRNCTIDAHKTYRTIGSAGKPVSMGTYGYTASLVVNFRMLNCRMENINDRSRWGVIGTNFMKNILLEDCVLSRMDVHQGVSGTYVIRRTTLGHAGLNAIGRGRLIVEDSTLHGRHLVSFRSDYGSTWDGVMLIRNCRWIPNAGAPCSPVLFGMRNDGTHDFGYPCYMPREIEIDGLFVDDAKHPKGYKGVAFFGDPIGGPRKERPFPYALTKTLKVRGLKTATGLPPRVATNPELAKAVALSIE